jgi:hypothetical protein
MVGGMISLNALTIALIPAIYAMVKQWCLRTGREFESGGPGLGRGAVALQAEAK